MVAVRELGASLLGTAGVDECRRLARRERGLHFHPGHLLYILQIGLRARRSASISRNQYQGDRSASDQQQQGMRNRTNAHVILLSTKKHKLVAVLTANRQCYKFIIITIILPFTHDSEIGPTPLGISARAERPSIYILYKRGSAVTRLRCHRFIQSPHATIVYNSPTTASRAALAGAINIGARSLNTHNNFILKSFH